MSAVQASVYRLTDLGVLVLSPADPRVVDQFGDFLFVASDRARAIKLVQSRHLAAIAASDFLWLASPEGYVGQSASMEIGYAIAVRTPIYAAEVATDLTLRQYVTVVADEHEAIREAEATAAQRRAHPQHVLIDPTAAVEAAHAELELMRNSLQSGDVRASRLVSETSRRLLDRFELPSPPN